MVSNNNLFFIHSVVSNSLRPHGLQHTRLPCPSHTISRSFLKLMSIESVMPSNHLILLSSSLIIIIIVIINTNQLKTVSIVRFQCSCDVTVSGFNEQCPESSDNTAKVRSPSWNYQGRGTSILLSH